LGTIDKYLFEKAGARGCSDSDYNLVQTDCCQSILVEDNELLDVYSNSSDLSLVKPLNELPTCPICAASTRQYFTLAEWPRTRTNWQWAYHCDQKVVESWLAAAP
jgi:hypothetical protein